MMRAIVTREPGAPDVLELRDVERPDPGPGDVLVRVASSGVNRADLLQRRGRYPAPPGWPQDILGLEFAGVVEEVGADCRSHGVGDRVMGVIGGGGYAEYVALHGRYAVRVPDGMDSEAAGAVPEVFMTAFDALFLQMGLVEGETLLIHAVGSGVGTAAVQLARASGVRTIGTSRTPEKLERAGELGLDVGVVGSEGWSERVLAATDGGGVDVVLDLVGAPYVSDNVKVLAVGGRWIVVGISGGAVAQMDLGGLMRKRASITGTVLRSRSLAEKIELAEAFAARVMPQFERGLLEPVIDRSYTPEGAADAHRRMEANLNFGKISITWA